MISSSPDTAVVLADYYKTLCVQPTAKLSDIRKAFFERAAQCHPARGGSDDEIKQVLEAWQVLSHAERRYRYDFARNGGNPKLLRRAAADAAAAAEKASRYPANWPDFLRANFSFKDILSLPLPGRKVGIALVIGGAAAGAAVGLSILLCIQNIWHVPNPFMVIAARLTMLPIIGGGAWIGWRIYLTWQSRGQEPLPNHPIASTGGQARTRTTFICPKCNTKLAVPTISQIKSGRSLSLPLRIIVALYVASLVATAFAPWSELLPSELRAWDAAHADRQSTAIANSFLASACAIGIVIAFVCHVVACVSLFWLKRWGLWLFAATFGFLSVANVLSGPFIYVGPQLLCDEISTFAAGGMLAIGFCTDVIPKKVH